MVKYLKWVLRILALIAIAGCSNPTSHESGCQQVIITGHLGEHETISLVVGSKIYRGWIIETDYDLTESDVSIDVKQDDGTWFFPQKKILGNEATLFVYLHSGMIGESEYKLLIFYATE